MSDHRVEIHASIGAAYAPGDADTAEGLLKLADLALYEAKAGGRRTLRFFQPEMERAARNKLELLADLREALRLGQFVLHFQPQVSLADGGLVGFEALVRWCHPERGMVSPLQFIPLAEESGLIVPLGQWVLQQACREAAQWPAHLRIAVNISAVEFERTELPQAVRQALADSGLPARRLELELTESTLLQDTEQAVRVLTELRAAGVRVALDDFGTGFSSLAYLRSFPLDVLKIDRSFVSTLGDADDRSAEAIVRSIQGLAEALGLETTAEGVETLPQQRLLESVGCGLAQGYLFSRPLEAGQARAYIEAGGGDGDTGAGGRAKQPTVTEVA